MEALTIPNRLTTITIMRFLSKCIVQIVAIAYMGSFY